MAGTSHDPSLRACVGRLSTCPTPTPNPNPNPNQAVHVPDQVPPRYKLPYHFPRVMGTDA
eukprot:scaffold4516_cov33-Phaeocystis_antarctica.AAC.2